MSAVLAPRLDYAPMRPEDLAAVMAVENAVYPFPWTEGNFRDSLLAGHSAWLCLLDRRMVGHAVLMQVLDEAHLLNISLAEAQQGCGLGAAFLAYLSDVAKGQGATRMFLEVRVSNERARRFYERNGFAEIGRRRGYYPAAAGREDAIVMARDL